MTRIILALLALLAAWPAHADQLICLNGMIIYVPPDPPSTFLLPQGCVGPAFITQSLSVSGTTTSSGTPSFPANACQSGRDHWPARWDDGKWVCYTEDR